MTDLPEKYLKRMREMLGGDYQRFLASMDDEPVRGLRVNTLKIGIDDFLNIAPWKLSPSGIMPEGFVQENGSEQSIGNHPYHLAGLFYIQEPSAMSAAAELDPAPGMRVLDMCAAPGGKAGAVAARMKGRGLLVANEIVPSRAVILSRNLERLGSLNSIVTNARPEKLADEFPGWFDAVLVDAPCSGEGMFRKDKKAREEWSPEHVKACAVRQSRILESGSGALKPGGVLVYSTCTFSYEENEGVVDDFLARHSDYELISLKRYYPHTFRGEGHFTAKLYKKSTAALRNAKRPSLFLPVRCRAESYIRFMDDVFEREPDGTPVALNDGRVLILPDVIPELSGLSVVSMGIEAGRIIKGRFEPAHALAMAAADARFKRSIELLGRAGNLARFLHGETLDVPSDFDGYYPVTYNGFALGWGKCAGGEMKNHLPKGIRLMKA